MRPLRILLLGTDYSHWSKYSGYAGFVPYLDCFRFEATVIRTPLGGERFPGWLSWSKDTIRRYVRKRGRNIFDLNDLMAEWQGLRHWLTRGSDVIHFLDGEHALLALPHLNRVARELGRPAGFLATFHQPPDFMKQMVSPHVTTNLQQILTVAPTQNSFFKECGAGKVTTLRHGINTDFFRPGNRPKGKLFTLLTVGRWMRDFEAVLKTARILQSDPRFEFHLVSPGIELRQMPPNMRMSTGVSDSELRRLYQEATLLFLPLKNATANNTLLEAAACGLPILSTDLPSVRFYFPGEEIRLVQNNHPREFVDAILSLHQKPDRLAYMSKLVLKRAHVLSWKRQAAKFEHIYQAVWQQVTESGAL